MSSDKFLVSLLSGLTQQHGLFLLWIVGGAVLLLPIWLNYRKVTRRNFRADSQGPHVSVTRRQLTADKKTLKPPSK